MWFTGYSFRANASLDLSKRNFSRIDDSCFKTSAKLVNLKLNENRLSFLPEAIFKGLSHLEELYCRHCKKAFLKG